LIGEGEAGVWKGSINARRPYILNRLGEVKSIYSDSKWRFKVKLFHGTCHEKFRYMQISQE